MVIKVLDEAADVTAEQWEYLLERAGLKLTDEELEELKARERLETALEAWAEASR